MQERFEQEVVAVRSVRVRGRTTLQPIEELMLSAAALMFGAVVGLVTRLI
jgi:hypothetical protein